MAHKVTAFETLPLDKNGGYYNAWGRFGENDQLGMLNLLTPTTVKAASKEIKEGVRIALDWPLSKPAHPFFGRQVFYHHIHSKSPRTVNDDVLLFNTQCSTQWDGFRHYGYQEKKCFYNGVTQEQIMSSDIIGINVWVENGGIVGRGVLMDYAAWMEKHNIKVNPLSSTAIKVSHLRQLAEEEKIVFQPGDILFIRSGFTKAYEALTTTEEANLPQRKDSNLIGVESSLDMAKWIWENQFAAVAGDMPGFEQAPIWDSPVQLHQILLAGWGCPIGEMFYLEELAKECKRLGRNTFFMTSVPLKVLGGVASPPNAVAIL